MDFGNLKWIWALGDEKKLGAGLYLGQYIGPYKVFEQRSRAASRVPTFSCFVESHGDVTDSVRKISYDRRSEDRIREPNYGTGNISVVDTDGTYIENGMPTFQQGQRIYIFAGFNDDNIPRFSGIIREVYLESDTKTITLDIAEEGYRLRSMQTSGDHSSYNTPKLLIDYLAADAGIGIVEYENETGRPTTVEFGDTYLQLRTYWAMIHGSGLVVGYRHYFDEQGKMQLVRRTSYEETDYIFDDDNIEYIKHDRAGEIINRKVIDYFHPIRPEFQAGDGVVAGQHTRSKSHATSKHKYGTFTNQETDELIGTWTNAGMVIDQVLDEYPFPQELYLMKCRALPQLQIDDRVFVNSAEQNVKGKFIIEKIKETITPRTFNNVFTISSARERF